MKLVSWNVNGLRAVLKRDFIEIVRAMDADFICLQETKMQEGQAEVPLDGYHQFWSSAEKKGYSGTAIFARQQPLAKQHVMGIEHHDKEGRIVQVEYPDFTLINVYTPNSQRGLARLDYRMQWEEDFRAWLMTLDESKPLIVCGDLNVAHQEIDIKNASSNRRSAGFTDEERAQMTTLLEAGFCDTFRTLHPETIQYTWWSYWGNARTNNVGWRIDYFLVSQRLMPQVQQAAIHDDIMGSDHCPVSLVIDI